jgi:hypothetical protein
MQSRFHRKKPYERPTCTQMSLSEIATFVRSKMLVHEFQFRGDRPSVLAGVSLLLVEDYGGDLKFIRPAVRAPARELEPFAIGRGVRWSEMQFADAERAEPDGTFLLLDLRHHHRGERAFLESIGHNQHPNETVPRVILANSSEDFLGWKGVDPKQCWQLRSCQTPEDLSSAIRSFLRLCSMVAHWPAEEDTAFDLGHDHALSASTDKE